MNRNDDEHTPLSAEELWKLLETKDQSALQQSGADDFEQDAIDGFSAHSSARNARLLTEEIHTLIDEKVQEKGTKRRPVLIWFSAAASVMLIIILSVYFLVETTETSTDLAINQPLTEQQQPEIRPLESTSAPALDKSEETKSQVPLQAGSTSTAVLRKGNGQQSTDGIEAEHKGILLEQEITNKVPALKDKLMRDDLTANVSKTTAAEGTKDDAMTFDRNSSSSGAFDLALGNTSSEEKAEKVQKEQVIVTYESVALSKQKSAYKKSDQKSDQQKPSAVVTASPSKNEALSRSIGNTTAYFNGGEAALKKNILDRLQQQGYKKESIKGAFKVKLKVFADGTLEIKEINYKKETGADKELIKKTLTTVSGWNPATIKGTPVDSEVIFEINFEQ